MRLNPFTWVPVKSTSDPADIKLARHWRTWFGGKYRPLPFVAKNGMISINDPGFGVLGLRPGWKYVYAKTFRTFIAAPEDIASQVQAALSQNAEGQRR